ncbi:MAG: DUF4493 domain-containing protein [Bacteroidaceae bacterium]|nr:DUF4493 domain-containing protein [Bacteroidaceae bacterium]
MKKLYFALIALLSVVLYSCTNEEVNPGCGFLTLNVSQVSSTLNVTRAVPEGYDAKQLAVEIVDGNGKVVLSTDDHTQWMNKELSLMAGTYTINAHSAYWDGNDSGRDVPYYAGSTEVTIKAADRTDANIVCTLANVKVTVAFDATVEKIFASAQVEVKSKVSGIASQLFTMGDAASLMPAYYPVGSLEAVLTVVNKAGSTYTMSTPINGVKARDHYILKYKTSEQGGASFVVTGDDTQTTFTYDFTVPTWASTQLRVENANAWSTFAYLEGSIPTSDIEINPAKVSFQMQEQGSSAWTTIAALQTSDGYKATAEALKPNTQYTYKMVYADGTDLFESNTKNFTTEGASALPFGNMDSWCTGTFGDYKCPYPCSQEEWDRTGKSFWGTSNAGTSLLSKYVTVEYKDDVHTAGGSAAKLGSQYVVIKFAAASLFAGEFSELVGTSGGKINFGQPWTDRPTQFTGWCKYSTGAINRVGTLPSSLSSAVVKNETQDTWSCYVAMMTEGFLFDNSSTALAQSTMPDFATDPRVIAYGEMPISECGANSEWKKFTVDLTYRDLKKKPSVIVIVISSSRYGDYFTGYDKATLLVDDLELVYGEPNK